VATTSDADLLEAWRSGDIAAGEALFERHFESVHRFFANKVWSDEVDDLVQEAFMGCVRGQDRVTVGFKAYLFGVARKQLLKHRDRWRRDHPKEDYETGRVAALDATPSQLAVAAEEQRLLLRALRRLPLDLQIALELFYWEEMRSADIAQVLGIPHGTARSRLRRARDLLREVLDRLEASPALLESTIGNLDRWLESIRGHIAGPGDGSRENSPLE
jgi:RNA polymerase sigma-70 factor (ECF subfamily)